MRWGPATFAIGILCFFLIGPAGPCGPSTELGFLLLLLGYLGTLAGWCGSAAAVAGAMRHDRSQVTRPGWAAAGVSAAVVVILLGVDPASPSIAWTPFALLWPPLTASGIAIARWRAKRRVTSAGVMDRSG